MMKATEMYENVCKMLNEYDLHTGNRGADAVIADPATWITGEQAKYFPFYASAAKMLVDCLHRMDASRAPSALGAYKRIIRNAVKIQGKSSEFAGMFKSTDGYYCLCDGYRAVRLNEDVSSLPHTEMARFEIDGMVDQAMKSSTEPLPLPLVSDLKAFLSACKAKGKKPERSPYKLPNGTYCNAQYLLDIVQALPECKAYVMSQKESKFYLKPVYFKAASGDAILLPMRPPKEAA